MSLVQKSTSFSMFGWSLRHDVGCSSFVLSKMLVGAVKADVFCVTDDRRGKRVAGKLADREGKIICSLVNGRAANKTIDDSKFFTCRLDGKQLFGSSLAAVDVSCRAVLGHIIFEGLSFVPEVTPLVCGPELKELARYYQGPSLCNSHLVDVIVGNAPSVNDFVAEECLACDFFRVRSTSAFYSGQHIPTHVTNATMSNALSRVFMFLGVDDNLALAVEAAVQDVRAAEAAAWRSCVRREMMRGGRHEHSQTL